MLHHEHGPDGVRRIVLVAGRGNALGPKLLSEIERAFDPESHEPGPVVLTGRGSSFCTGLDLSIAYELDREGMRELMSRFHRALRAVLGWPGPVVASIQGHALAGGALLALCADARVMASGGGRFGIHGVQLGVVYPQIAVEVLRWRIERGLAERVLYRGRIRPAHEALEAGLVDELADPEALVERSGQYALARLAPAGLKSAVLRPVLDRLGGEDEEDAERWLDHWFAEGTREKVGAARDALLTRNGGSRPGETET